MSVQSLHLASSSPRRYEILSALGLTFTAAGVDVDEQRLDGEPPGEMVVRLATLKAQAAAGIAELVIGADTAVVLDGMVYGKPTDEAEALAMLAELSGRRHEVLTGVAVTNEHTVLADVSTTEVRFRDIRPDEARAYWQSGEPRDKAGAYAIQGRGGAFVKAISGSYTGVVGLPVFETTRLLEIAGMQVLRSNAVAVTGPSRKSRVND